MDEKVRKVLLEILKCPVCLEVPKGRKVLICETGHHCCLNCHKQLKICGVCRGKLIPVRSYPVEDLISQFGDVLVPSEQDLPPPEAPVPYPGGSYQCQHRCPARTSSDKMLSHLRAKHSHELIDDVRSNPITGWFSYSQEIPLAANLEYIRSAHVSDMGLFVFVAKFLESSFTGYVKVLGGFDSPLFTFAVKIRISSPNTSKPVYEFKYGSFPVLRYDEDIAEAVDRGRVFLIQSNDMSKFASEGDIVKVFFSVARQGTEEPRSEYETETFPSTPLYFRNDRKTRRNRNRNLRRKKLKELLRNLARDGGRQDELADDLAHLNIQS